MRLYEIQKEIWSQRIEIKFKRNNICESCWNQCDHDYYKRRKKKFSIKKIQLLY